MSCALRQLLRATVELGVDAIKIALPETLEELDSTFESIHEDVLLFVAGGDLGNEELLLSRIEHALTCGASGVCIGRNVFARRQVGLFLEKLSEIVHTGSRLSTHPRERLRHAH